MDMINHGIHAISTSCYRIPDSCLPVDQDPCFHQSLCHSTIPDSCYCLPCWGLGIRAGIKDFYYGKPPQNGYAIENYSLHLRQPSVIHEYHLSDRYGRSGLFQWSVPGGIMRSSVMAALPRPLPGGEREGWCFRGLDSNQLSSWRPIPLPRPFLSNWFPIYLYLFTAGSPSYLPSDAMLPPIRGQPPDTQARIASYLPIDSRQSWALIAFRLNQTLHTHAVLPTGWINTGQGKPPTHPPTYTQH